MKKFCLLCSGLRTSVPDDLLDQLWKLPGVHFDRVKSGIVSVYFDGTDAEMHALLAKTAWSAFYVGVSEVRVYNREPKIMKLSSRKRRQRHDLTSLPPNTRREVIA